jgi:protein-S-isoprenylcysteine O-methyltransferase Ste14
MPEDTVFRILAAVSTVLGIAISAYYRDRADRAGGRMGRTEAPPIRWLLNLFAVGALFGLLAYFFYPSAIAWSFIPIPSGLRWVGVVLSFATNLAIVAVMRHLGLNVTRTVATRSDATLVTTGPYHYVRHPLYMTGMVAIAALTLVSRSWWFMAMALPGFMLLAIRVREEEANLIAKFGDAYREYMRRTGRFVPRWS